MDKITHQVRAEHWTRILNECMNSGMSKTAWCRANVFFHLVIGLLPEFPLPMIIALLTDPVFIHPLFS